MSGTWWSGRSGTTPGARRSPAGRSSTRRRKGTSGRARLSVRLPERDLRYTLEDAGARALVYAGRYGEVTARLLAELPGPGLSPVLCVSEAEGGPGPRQLNSETALAGAGSPPPTTPVGPDSLYCLFYTSGTT